MKNIAQDFEIIFRQLNLFLRNELKGTDISPSVTMYLGFLYQHDGATQDDLVKAFSVDKAAIARTVQQMEENGFIRRETDSRDKRAKCIFLTEKALLHKDRIIQLQDTWHSLTSEGITHEDSAVFEKVLAKITENAKSVK